MSHSLSSAPSSVVAPPPAPSSSSASSSSPAPSAASSLPYAPSAPPHAQQQTQYYYQQQQQQQQQPAYYQQPPYATPTHAGGYDAGVAPPPSSQYPPSQPYPPYAAPYGAPATAYAPPNTAYPPYPSSFDPFHAASVAASWSPSIYVPPTSSRSAAPNVHYPPNFDPESEYLFLLKLEKKAHSLQHKGHMLYAIELLEQAVNSRKMLYGEGSVEVSEIIEKLGVWYNSLAMNSLYKEDYKTCLKLLRKAEIITSSSPVFHSIRIQTLNNLACCYRRLQRPKTALNLLRESLELLEKSGTLEGRPVTHLNMCAILSQLGRHEEALEHAKAAVLHCQKQLLSNELQEKLRVEQEKEANREREGKNRRDHADNKPSHQILTEKIVILGIAYHNLGVEEEFLKHFDKCLEWYLKALELAREHIGEQEEITNTFRESYHAAKKQIAHLSSGARARPRPSSAHPSSSPFTHSRTSSSSHVPSQSRSRSSSRPVSAQQVKRDGASATANNRRPMSAAAAREKNYSHQSSGQQKPFSSSSSFHPLDSQPNRTRSSSASRIRR